MPDEEFKLKVSGTVAPAAAVVEEICSDAVCPMATLAIMQKNTPRLIILLTDIISDLKLLIMVPGNAVLKYAKVSNRDNEWMVTQPIDDQVWL